MDTPSQSFLFFASGRDFTFALKGTASYCCWEDVFCARNSLLMHETADTEDLVGWLLGLQFPSKLNCESYLLEKGVRCYSLCKTLSLTEGFVVAALQ